MINQLLFLAVASADFPALHQTIDQTTVILAEECISKPETCAEMVAADLALVEQLESTYGK